MVSSKPPFDANGWRGRTRARLTAFDGRRRATGREPTKVEPRQQGAAGRPVTGAASVRSKSGMVCCFDAPPTMLGAPRAIMAKSRKPCRKSNRGCGNLAVAETAIFGVAFDLARGCVRLSAGHAYREGLSEIRVEGASPALRERHPNPSAVSRGHGGTAERHSLCCAALRTGVRGLRSIADVARDRGHPLGRLPLTGALAGGFDLEQVLNAHVGVGSHNFGPRRSRQLVPVLPERDGARLIARAVGDRGGPAPRLDKLLGCNHRRMVYHG